VSACETALWPAGTFWGAYSGNRDEALEGVIDADPVSTAVRGLLTTRTEWTGTASELLGALAEQAGERVAKAKTWPDSPRALAGRLRRAATFLRKIGIEIGFEREGRARTRIIRITVADTPSTPECARVQSSAPSASSAFTTEPSQINGFFIPQPRTVATSADDSDRGSAPTVRVNPLTSNSEADADGADAKKLSHSASERTGWSARL
jgi:hypothetical protein